MAQLCTRLFPLKENVNRDGIGNGLRGLQSHLAGSQTLQIGIQSLGDALLRRSRILHTSLHVI